MNAIVEFDGRHGNLYLLGGNTFTTRNVETGHETRVSMHALPGRSTCAALSPDKGTLAVLSPSVAPQGTCELVLVSTASGEEVATVGRRSGVSAVAFLPDSRYIALGLVHESQVDIAESPHDRSQEPDLRRLGITTTRLRALHLTIVELRTGDTVFDHVVSRQAESSARITSISVPPNGRHLSCDVVFSEWRAVDTDTWIPFTLLYKICDDGRLEKILDVHGRHSAASVLDHDGALLAAGEDEFGDPYLFSTDGRRLFALRSSTKPHTFGYAPGRRHLGRLVGFTRDRRFFIRSWGGVMNPLLVLHETSDGREYAAFHYAGMYEHASDPRLSLDHESLVYTYGHDDYYGGFDGFWASLFHLHYDQRSPLNFARIPLDP